MHESPPLDFESWKSELESAWREIPKQFRSERSIAGTLQCRLYERLRCMGLAPVANYMPPRIADRPVDLIGVNASGEIACAVCIDVLVTLAAVKSLTSFDSAHKLIITVGHLEKKVQESRFFLKPEVAHIHLKPFEK